jgi:hypothetical protein
MEFRIADTFTGSLARLSGDEQKAVKTTAFDLQLNPAHPSLQFHRLDKAKDQRFWSVRVNLDLRLIVHRTESSLLLCYTGHHDDAYQWAERRKLETHPKTGAAQLVEIRERVQEIVVPKYVKPCLFADVPEAELLSYGVPVEWLKDVRQANEDSLLELAGHLPAEAAEALLDLATGARPKTAQAPMAGGDPFAHPDAQRRFRVMSSLQELERALNDPWDKWTVFLHPAQRQLVERDNNGPARISGSAGTGKTIVALHRAVFLARKHADARVLLATFSDTLASALRGKLRCLIGNEPRLGERVEVHSMNALGRRLYELNFGRAKIASREQLLGFMEDAAEGNRFPLRFLMGEWEQVVEAWQLNTWEGYRDVARLGRKTRLPEAQRRLLWSIFEGVRERLNTAGLITWADLFSRLAARIEADHRPPFDFAVIDEAQDIRVAQLRFLAALGAGEPNRLFFAGDLGQRIYQQPFSWKAVGVDVRGRSSTLRVNYRTSHQIRVQADRLLAPELSDVDGNVETRRGTISLFNGPEPAVQTFDDCEAESQAVAEWLLARTREGVAPHEFGVFVRSAAQLDRARAAVSRSGVRFRVLDENVETVSGQISIGTMHLAKGLEFRAVVVMACDDEAIPLEERMENVTDDSDLEEVYNSERQLLYVACTRARDHLLVTGVRPASEFLDDFEPLVDVARG